MLGSSFLPMNLRHVSHLVADLTDVHDVLENCQRDTNLAENIRFCSLGHHSDIVMPVHWLVLDSSDSSLVNWERTVTTRTGKAFIGWCIEQCTGSVPRNGLELGALQELFHWNKDFPWAPRERIYTSETSHTHAEAHAQTLQSHAAEDPTTYENINGWDNHPTWTLFETCQIALAKKLGRSCGQLCPDKPEGSLRWFLFDVYTFFLRQGVVERKTHNSSIFVCFFTNEKGLHIQWQSSNSWDLLICKSSLDRILSLIGKEHFSKIKKNEKNQHPKLPSQSNSRFATGLVLHKALKETFLGSLLLAATRWRRNWISSSLGDQNSFLLYHGIDRYKLPLEKDPVKCTGKGNQLFRNKASSSQQTFHSFQRNHHPLQLHFFPLPPLAIDSNFVGVKLSTSDEAVGQNSRYLQ